MVGHINSTIVTVLSSDSPGLDSSAAIKLLIPCSVNRFRLITHQKATCLAEVIEKWSLNVLLRGLP